MTPADSRLSRLITHRAAKGWVTGIDTVMLELGITDKKLAQKAVYRLVAAGHITAHAVEGYRKPNTAKVKTKELFGE